MGKVPSQESHVTGYVIQEVENHTVKNWKSDNVISNRFHGRSKVTSKSNTHHRYVRKSRYVKDK